MSLPHPTSGLGGGAVGQLRERQVPLAVGVPHAGGHLRTVAEASGPAGLGWGLELADPLVDPVQRSLRCTVESPASSPSCQPSPCTAMRRYP